MARLVFLVECSSVDGEQRWQESAILRIARTRIAQQAAVSRYPENVLRRELEPTGGASDQRQQRNRPVGG